MSKCVIAAVRPGADDPPLFFLGYQDDGAGWVCRWTSSRHHAHWFAADEAEIEAGLLTLICAGYEILPEPLDA